MTTTRPALFCMTALAVLAACGAAAGQSYPIRPDQPPPSFPASNGVGAGHKVGDIVTQPVRDVGIDKNRIPQILAAAAENPYRVDGVQDCEQLSHSIESLDAVLGADFVDPTEAENRKGRLAEAGGRMVVNSLIPFRGIVREISGAAMHDREMARAVDAGFARRGFLRGLEYTKGCRAQTASLKPLP